MILLGLAGCWAALASSRPGAVAMPGLAAGTERKAPGAGAPAPAAGQGDQNRARVALKLEGSLEAKYLDAEKALVAARHVLRNTGDPAKAREAEAEVNRLDAERARIYAALLKARQAVFSLRQTGAAAGLDSGDAAESKAAAAPGSHPFFAPLDRLRPGQVLRYALPRDPGGLGRPARLVVCGDGSLAWLNDTGTAVGVLRPGGRPQRLRDLEGDEGEAVFLDLAADQDTLWILGRFPGRGYGVAAVGRDGRTAIHPLPEDAQKEPLVMALNPADRHRGPWILGEDHLKILHLGSDRSLAYWKSWDRQGGPAPRRGDRAVLDGMVFHLVSPGTGRISRLDLDPKGVRLRDRDLAGGQATDLAWSSSEPYRMWFTDPAADRLVRLSRLMPKGAEPFQLVQGAAPGAIAPGPQGHLVVAAAHGFGLVTPAGDVVRLAHQGPPVTAVQLVPGPAAGKVYFLEAGRPCLQALVLPFTEAGAGAPAWSQGPSMLADRQSAAEDLGAETKAVAPKAPARPATSAGAGAGAAGDEERKPSAPEAPATAGVTWPWDARPESPGASAEAPVNLVHHQITAERMDHIFDEHTFDPQAGAGGGWAKGQFLPATPRELAQMLVAGANGAGVEERYENDADRVLEFRAPREIGRVRLEEAKDWQPTRRVRIVLRLGWDSVRRQEREYLASAYPIPERADEETAAAR